MLDNRSEARASRLVGTIASIGLLAAPQALAAPTPVVERESPMPVTAIDRQQLETLPANRDLRSILELHNQLRSRTGVRPLRWNPTLAANAERYAPLAAIGTCAFVAGRPRERAGEYRRRPAKRHVAGATSPDLGSGGAAVPSRNLSRRMRRRLVEVQPLYADDLAHDDRRRLRLCAREVRRAGVPLFPAGQQRRSPSGPDAGPRPARAEGLCTTPRGVTIPCQNAPGGAPAGDGGTIQDDGGPDKDSGIKEEVACLVDVNVHKPISVAPDEPVIADAKEISPGAITLRNDDSDWRLGGEGGAATLPIISLPSDLSHTGNANENDLVKVVALNPNRLPGVYLFAFPINAEADLELNTQVAPVYTGRQANRDQRDQLGYFDTATKAAPAPDLPVLVPDATTMWVEGKLGGR